MDKKEVSNILEKIGLMLELKGENPFKSRAYYNGARIIETLDESLLTLVDERRLDKIAGIGKTLQEKITELVTTGRLQYYEDLMSDFPDTIFELLKVPGLGPKKVRVLYNELDIKTLGELEYACMENRLIYLPGFGKKTQQNIIKGIESINRYRGQYLFSDAWTIGNIILQKLETHISVQQVSIAGSLRRKKELIKDIDMLAASESPEQVMEYFTTLPEVEDIIAKGLTKSSVRLNNGIAVDLRVTTVDQYPYALHHFTGSKEHNTAMRHQAKKMGIKMNEYGLFKGEQEELIVCRHEEDIFRSLGMAYIDPELREDMGEIERAQTANLPSLVEESDIKGIFHVHSLYSDGANSLEELAAEAQHLGYQYIGITDHSQSAFYANGLKEEDIIKQIEEIDELNKRYKDFKIFKGIESDILKDGSLDYSDDILAQFDFVIASVHSNFSMNKSEMTSRIVNAMDNTYITILGHPTGRLLLSRDEYELDMEKILEKAAERNIVIEINANPHRLDLDWRWCRKAKDMNVKIAICPDAHDIKGLKHIVFGVGIARKGWLEKKDIINCLDVNDCETFLTNKNI
jgi:DNA polymerase (family 10)